MFVEHDDIDAACGLAFLGDFRSACGGTNSHVVFILKIRLIFLERVGTYLAANTLSLPKIRTFLETKEEAAARVNVPVSVLVLFPF